MWGDVEFLEYPLDGKCLFIYLCTNPLTTESGIYQLPLKTTSYYTSIPQDRIEYLIDHVLHNVIRDKENKLVFVKKFHRYNFGGRTDLVRTSILGDYKQTRHSFLWNYFLDEYPEFKTEIKEVAPIPKTNQTMPSDAINYNPKQSSAIISHPIEFTMQDDININQMPSDAIPTIRYTNKQDSLVNSVRKGNGEKNEKTTDSPPNGGNDIKDLTYWMLRLNNSSKNGHDKIAILVDAFKFICAGAPSYDFTDLGGRLAGIAKLFKADYGVVLRNMYLCPVYKPDGSWLNYIEKMQTSKYDNNFKNKVDDKNKIIHPAPKTSKAKDVILRTQERK